TLQSGLAAAGRIRQVESLPVESAAVDIAVVDSARGASEPGAARAGLEARTPAGAGARVPPAVDEAPGAPAVEVRGGSAVCPAGAQRSTVSIWSSRAAVISRWSVPPGPARPPCCR